MTYTLGTASKATGVSRSTVLRAIKSGKISATPDVHGVYQIEPAELFRVYPSVADKAEQKEALLLHTTAQSNIETAVLRSENKLLRGQLEEKDETLKDLRNRLDQADKERRETLEKLVPLLTDQRLKPEPKEEKSPIANHATNKTHLAFYISSMILLVGLIILLLLKQQA
jgi:hypothetical protein